MSRLAFVFAKEPEPGRVKTRLCPPLSHEQAARAHEAFLADTLSRLATVGGVELRLAVSPDAGGPRLLALAERYGLLVVAQGAGDLGQRMNRVLTGALADADAAVLLGADSPDLPTEYVERAFTALRTEEAVVGPSEDGGYYLIGASRPIPSAFALEAEWGGPRVFEATVARLGADGTRFSLLPPWDDVDEAADLARLAGRIGVAAGQPKQGTLEATSRFLSELAGEGVKL